jgi:succinate dehydrogenase / fumarate reductase membrane anchor subunit
MSLRSPLGRVLGHGSAGEGVHHWWIQRVTAIALVPLTMWFAWSLLRLPLRSHELVSAWLGKPWVAVLSVLLVLTLAWHSKLGVQVVIEDYVHGTGAKTTLLLLSVFVHFSAAVAATFAILVLALA